MNIRDHLIQVVNSASPDRYRPPYNEEIVDAILADEVIVSIRDALRPIADNEAYLAERFAHLGRRTGPDVLRAAGVHEIAIAWTSREDGLP